MSFERQHHDEIEKVNLTADEKLWVMNQSASCSMSRSSYIRSLIVADRLRVARNALWQQEFGVGSANIAPVNKG